MIQLHPALHGCAKDQNGSLLRAGEQPRPMVRRVRVRDRDHGRVGSEGGDEGP